MSLRLTTPGLVVALLAAIAVAVGVATQVMSRPDDAFVDIAPAPPSSTSTLQMDTASVYAKRIGGVVSLDAVFADGTVGGSGFVIDRDGHVVTSSHVVVDYAHGGTRPEAVYVNFHANETVPARILGIDSFNDVAVLKVDPDEVEHLQPLPLGDVDEVVVGQQIAAIGAPFSNDGSLTTGIVSATHRTVDAEVSAAKIADAIQVDAPINPGNSGGPILDARGRVIAMSQQIRTTSGTSEGVAFGVPIDLVARAVRQIVKTGTVRYARLGLTTTTVTPQMARQFDLPARRGVLVASADGPAAAAGLRAGPRPVVFNGQEVRLGDQIVSIAHAPVATDDDVYRIASRLDVGQRVQVVFYRDGKRRTVQLVTDEKRP